MRSAPAVAASDGAISCAFSRHESTHEMSWRIEAYSVS